MTPPGGDATPDTARVWPVHLGLTVPLHYSLHAQFTTRVGADGLGHVVEAMWHSDDAPIEIPGRTPLASVREGKVEGVLTLDPDVMCLLARRTDGPLAAAIAASSPELADREMARLRELYPDAEDEPPEASTVPVKIWSGEGTGPRGRRRRIPVRGWNEIAENYPHDARLGLRELMGLTPRDLGHGRVVIWHGEPGTGKTHALRALADRWQEWCYTHVILDPEVLLRDADYLLDIATYKQRERPEHVNLIVLEDAGELLSADARERVGQGLSRFLNLCDGIAGDGVRALVLVTTNEPIGRLHPAVTRPGRAISEIEFAALPVEEANAWLARRGSELSVREERTIAELYALAAGHDDRGDGRRPIGFAA